jgi:hypothetical protein
MVRDNDSILIDFGSTQSGPLVADPASLEVALAFYVGGEDDDDQGWIEIMNTLYSRDFLDGVPPPAREPRPREWLWNIVRQIRQIALGDQQSDLEYRTALILYLLRHSTFESESEKEEKRRAYAYVIAERIASEMAKEKGVPA